MMATGIDALKRMPLVEFLERIYGMTFKLVGGEYLALSPFTGEKEPSFFVRQVEGRWLFKDFSSGEGGSIIDFVRIKENLPHDIPAIIERVEELARGAGLHCDSSHDLPAGQKTAEPAAPSRMSVEELYQSIRGNGLGPVKAYLQERCIGEGVIEELEARELLVHNRWKGKSWAGFVVRDTEGKLRCLANEEIEGPEKFIYGKKYPFSMNPKAAVNAEELYVTEGILDLLSLRTLLGSRCEGFALLGNELSVLEPGMVEKAGVIHAALDHDKGGLMGLMGLNEAFSDKEIRALMFDDIKDPNELLMKLRNKREEIPPDAKVWLYKQAQKTKNKAELARRWGVDRSHLYELLREGDEALGERFSEKRRGRAPQGRPRTLQEALRVIEELEKRYDEMELKYQEEHVASAFAGLRLKWAEEELDEHDPGKAKDRKSQLKKNKR